MLDICEKSGQLYFQFDSLLWLLHLADHLDDALDEDEACAEARAKEAAISLICRKLKDIN